MTNYWNSHWLDDFFSDASLSLCKHVYENNTHAVRVLYSLSELQSTITLGAQDSLCTLKTAKSLDGPDLYAFRSRVLNARNTGGSDLRKYYKSQ